MQNPKIEPVKSKEYTTKQTSNKKQTKNKHRFKSSGEVKINDNGLTAIALLVAQSKPEEKEIIIQLIMALISG